MNKELKGFIPIIIAIITILAIALGMVLYERSLGPVGPGEALMEGKLLKTQKESLSIVLDLCKLLITWTIALLGAAAFFLKLNLEKGVMLRRTDVVLSFIIILLGIISLFFGHLFLERTSLFLSAQQFPVEKPELWLIGRLQYIFFLGAVATFGFHIFQFFWFRLPNTRNLRREAKNGV